MVRIVDGKKITVKDAPDWGRSTTRYKFSGYRKYIVVNRNDRMLKPFVIWLPKPPHIRYIDGYRNKKSEQVFHHVEIPQRLTDLEKRITDKLKAREAANRNDRFTPQKLIVSMWEHLKTHSADYQKEINFIKIEQWRLINGYWIMIEGEPIYLNPWNYRYVNYWELDGGILPEWRFRDWEWFHVHKYFYDDPYTMGVNYPKHRRDGATSKSLCVEYSVLVEKGRRLLAGIQSYTGDHAKDLYVEKFIPAFKHMPFYTKPLWQGTDTPMGGLRFQLPPGIGQRKVLESHMRYAKTASAKAFDGKKLDIYLGDEGGKTTEVNVLKRHDIVKSSVTLGGGNKIIGFVMYPTTVADLDSGGGRNYYTLCEQSHNDDRDEVTKQTKSGTVNYFKSGDHGLEGFIDKFGKDVVEDPTEKDLWRLVDIKRDDSGNLIGARRYITSKRAALLKSNNEDDIISYQKYVREYPMEYIECFGGMDGGGGFDVISLKRRREELMVLKSRGENPVRVGNFVWNIGGTQYTSDEFVAAGLHLVKGITDKAKVEWVDDKDGRWEVSYFPKKTNERYKSDGEWFPTDFNSYTHSADPFQFLKDNEIDTSRGHSKSSLSYGAIAAFRERDYKIDPPDKDIKDWQTHNFVADYLYRPSDINAYCEDVIMQMVFYGGTLFPEVNVKKVWEYVVQRNFSGYLLYGTDASGKLRKHPGFNSSAEIKQELFTLHKSFIVHHTHKNNHIRIINSQINIKGLKDMTNQDAFVSAGGCLLGSQSRMRDYIQELSETAGGDEEYFDIYTF